MINMLVTGGAGFIGSNFIKYMLNINNDFSIINLDCLTYAGNLENLKDINNDLRYKFIKGDIADRNLVANLFDEYDFDYVINFAAETHVDRSIHNPEIFIQTNVLGTLNLLDNAKSKWQINKDSKGYPAYRENVKFIQVSTDEVYGALGKTGMFTETTPLSPNSPYSASKASADMLVMSYNKTYKLPINITRCSNNYGPYQFPEKLIPLMIGNAMDESSLPVYGDGMQVRDWLHVKDHCSAIYTVLEKGKHGEVYNIGGNNEKANIEIVKTILNYLDKPESLIIYVEDRLGHDRRYAIDNTKITKELGWSPSYSFEAGINETIKWYLENKKWLDGVRTGTYLEFYKLNYGI